MPRFARGEEIWQWRTPHPNAIIWRHPSPPRRTVAFPATHISVVQRTASPDPETRARALDALAAVYWRPIYVHIRLSHGVPVQDAEDMTQGFFADALRRSLFGRFDASRARFRTFLRTCVDAYVANTHKSNTRLKRGGATSIVPIDVADLEAQIAVAPEVDRAFHDEWVRGVFSSALARLRERYEAAGKPVQYAVFEQYEVVGANADPRPTYADVAAMLGITTVQATNWLNAARRDFRSSVLETLRDLTGSEEEFRDEARALLGADNPA
jgi:DNA-directed RNA polymerase specialized sigma24 family protein